MEKASAWRKTAELSKLSSAVSSQPSREEKVQQIYQNALKLLCETEAKNKPCAEESNKLTLRCCDLTTASSLRRHSEPATPQWRGDGSHDPKTELREV